MNELTNITRDIRSGALPADELPRFALFVITKNIGKASIILITAFVIAYAVIN